MSEKLIIDGLRESLQGNANAFVEALAQRAHHLMVNMVDGRVLPQPDVDQLKASIMQFVKNEAVPVLSEKNPTAGIAALDQMSAYGMPRLEQERSELEAVRAAKFKPPAPVDWPELDGLRHAAENADVCTLEPPVTNVYFARILKDEEGLRLPEELLSLYAAANGFDLSCSVATYLPVFSLLPTESIDVSESSGKYPKRAAVFQGGDSVQLAVYRDAGGDRKKTWWLVYEYDYEPIARVEFNLRELLQFGIQRMKAPSGDALEEELSWARFFRTKGED
ncbi:MAG: hypothetical protein JRH20_18140 [Deltaproteobacteria bacterium]|nr:hypothetical protein [Deltaproteobacteria bacterium]